MWFFILLLPTAMGSLAGYCGALYVYNRSYSDWNNARIIRAVDGGYIDGDLMEVLYYETFHKKFVADNETMESLFRQLISQPVPPYVACEKIGQKYPAGGEPYFAGVACLGIDIEGFGKKGDIIWVIWSLVPSAELGSGPFYRPFFRDNRIVNAYWVNARTGAVRSIFPPEVVRKQLQGPLPGGKRD